MILLICIFPLLLAGCDSNGTYGLTGNNSQTNQASATQVASLSSGRSPELQRLAVLVREATVAMQSGDDVAGYRLFQSAGEVATRMIKDGFVPSDSQRTFMANIFYTYACSLARQDLNDQAIEAILQAAEMGFNDPELLISDANFDKIRSHPEFKETLDRLQALKSSEQAQIVKRLLETNTSFPFEFSLPDVDGNLVSITDFRGKTLIVDIWGTWCPPCRMEVPHFVRLQEKYAAQGLQVVGINYEQSKSAEVAGLVRDFQLEHAINYPCLIGDSKTRGQIPDFQGYPTTLFIDGEGRVRAKLAGYTGEAILEGLVQELLAEQP